MKIEKHEMTPQIRQDIKERQKNIWDCLFYSNQRMDLLIITISGAGLYVAMESVKYLLEQKSPIHISLKIASMLFVSSIITNFLSQYYSAKTHHKDYCSTILQLEENRTEDQDKALLKYDDESEKHNKTTNRLNVVSMLLMFAGLITITVILFSIF